MIFALENLEGMLIIKPDAAYLVDGYRDGFHLAPQGTNADLWFRIGTLVKGREHLVKVVKVDAHLEPQQVIEGDMSITDFHGNALADAMAALGASLSQVPDAVAECQAATDARSWMVLKRLVAVNMHVVKTAGKRTGALRPKREKGARSMIQRLMDQAGHDFGGLRYPRRVSKLSTML